MNLDFLFLQYYLNSTESLLSAGMQSLANDIKSATDPVYSEHLIDEANWLDTEYPRLASASSLLLVHSVAEKAFAERLKTLQDFRNFGLGFNDLRGNSVFERGKLYL